MNKREPFWSIPQLFEAGYSITEIATAIEVDGFYTWDRFGRFVKVPPIDKGGIFSELRDAVLDALAEGIKAGEVDSDYFLNMYGPTVLGTSGWDESKLPNFGELETAWSKKYSGSVNTPSKQEPPKQSKIWDVFRGLLRVKYGDGVIDDLNSGYSEYGSKIKQDLELKGIDIETKTLKTYINKK